MRTGRAQRVYDRQMPETPHHAQDDRPAQRAEALAHAWIGEATPANLLKEPSHQAKGEPEHE